MVKKYVEFCDLCLTDGIERFAIARYWNEDDEEWHACRIHLKSVKEIGLDYELLEDNE